MTIEKFKEIEYNVIETIKGSFEYANKISSSDFILLVARGGYHEHLDKPEDENTPFVIDDKKDFLMDLSRKRFFVMYINNYISRLLNDNPMSDDEKEYDTNIQLMIYTHIWESHLFLNQIVRLAKIQQGEGYNWKTKLDFPPQHRKKNTPGYINKGTFISDDIIKLYENSDHEMAKLIKHCYLKDLRNDFAHSTYYIYGNTIVSNGKGLFSGQPISIEEWEDKFVSTMLLSYHLNDMLLEFKNQYIDTFGDKPIVIMLPSKKNNNIKKEVYIKPERIEGKEEKVRFRFVMKDELKNL